jgi:hypothetical protein
MLFIAWGGGRGRRRDSGCSRLRSGIANVQTCLPSIALTGFNCSPIALEWHGAVLSLNGYAPEMPFLDPICIMFLDSLSTINGSLRRDKNRVFCEGRGNGGGIVVVVCFSFSFKQVVECLAQLGIWCVALLGK